MKALEGANTEARVQVADARNRGDIGVAERQVHLRSFNHDALKILCEMRGLPWRTVSTCTGGSASTLHMSAESRLHNSRAMLACETRLFLEGGLVVVIR